MSLNAEVKKGLAFYVDEARREYEFAGRHIDYGTNRNHNFMERMESWLQEVDDVLSGFYDELEWYSVIDPNHPITP